MVNNYVKNVEFSNSILEVWFSFPIRFKHSVKQCMRESLILLQERYNFLEDVKAELVPVVISNNTENYYVNIKAERKTTEEKYTDSLKIFLEL